MRRFASIIFIALAACGRSPDPELVRRLDEQEKRISELERRVAERPAPIAIKPAAPPPIAFPMPVQQPTATAPTPPTQTTPPVGGVPSTDELRRLANAKLAIRANCSKQFGSQWMKVDQCEREETAALEQLAAGNTFGIPESVYSGIRSQCASRWGEHYSMQLACQQGEVEEYSR